MNIKLKIGTKIALSFGVIIALMLLMAITSGISLNNAKGDLLKINQANIRMELADKIVSQYQGTIADIRSYVAYGDEGQISKIENDFNQVLNMEKELLSLARPEKREAVQGLLDQTTKYKDIIMTTYIPVAKQYNGELAAGNTIKAQEYKLKLIQIAKDVAGQAAEIEKTINGFSAINAEATKGLIKESSNDANTVMMTSLLISLVAVLIGIFIAIRLTNAIRKPVIELTSVANEYANGDLRNEVTVHTFDEIGELADSVRMMHTNFLDMITNIRSASGQLASASQEMAASTQQVTATSGEISNNMQNLAKEAESGNSSMLEAAQALVQLSSLIQMAKSKADNTRKNSENTLMAAENGRLKVTESVSKMGNIKSQGEYSSQIISELNEYSKQISQITDTITGLAKQTNLLALNAAIEAARAGEQGRGFAVVAEEVRKLAEQSDKGAQEITSLVTIVTEKTNLAVAAMAQNVVEVETGVSTVNEAGLALDIILNAVQQTTGETAEISKLTSEEVANSEQIIKLIDHLATVIETVAAHGEEVSASSEEQAAAMQNVAASAEETSAMAQQLESSVAKFQI